MEVDNSMNIQIAQEDLEMIHKCIEKVINNPELNERESSFRTAEEIALEEIRKAPAPREKTKPEMINELINKFGKTNSQWENKSVLNKHPKETLKQIYDKMMTDGYIIPVVESSDRDDSEFDISDSDISETSTEQLEAEEALREHEIEELEEELKDDYVKVKPSGSIYNFEEVNEGDLSFSELIDLLHSNDTCEHFRRVCFVSLLIRLLRRSDKELFFESIQTLF